MMGYVLENPDRSRRSRPKPSIAVMLSIIAGSIGLTSEPAAAVKKVPYHEIKVEIFEAYHPDDTFER
jgi:hypothetical protein